MPNITFHQVSAGNWAGVSVNFEDGNIIKRSNIGSVPTGFGVINVQQRAANLGINTQITETVTTGIEGTSYFTYGVADWNHNNWKDNEDPVTVTVSGNQGSYSLYYDNTTADGDWATYQWKSYNPLNPPGTYPQVQPYPQPYYPPVPPPPPPGWYPPPGWIFIPGRGWCPPPPPPPPPYHCPPGCHQHHTHCAVDEKAESDPLAALEQTQTVAPAPEEAAMGTQPAPEPARA